MRSSSSRRIDGDRLIGRGAYDMKGGSAAMMVAARDVAERTDVRVHFVCVADEESDETELRASDWLVKHGYIGDFAITGEPTDMKIGVQAKGVLALRLLFEGRAAHGSTPWQGDNAVLKALHGFRRIEQMGWAQESSELFPRASVNLGRIMGGDALNKVPDRCVIDLDIRYLPGQEPGKIQQEIASLPNVEVRKVFHRRPIMVEATNPFVQLLAQAVEEGTPAPVDLRRARRDLGRDQLPRGRSAGGGVRPHRCRPPRSGGVGINLFAGAVSQDARQLRRARRWRHRDDPPAHCLTSSRDPATTGSGFSAAR